jgi:hypothetical protein
MSENEIPSATPKDPQPDLDKSLLPVPAPASLGEKSERISPEEFKGIPPEKVNKIEMEKKVVFSQQGQESRGQFLGFVIAIVGLLCGTYVAVSGQPWAGAAIGGTPLVGLVSVFVLSKHIDKADLSEKKKQLEEEAIPPPPNLSHTRKKKYRR